MKQLLILICLTAIAAVSSAQEAGKVVATVKGKVINSVTSEPVSYTNIGIEGTFFGTASNSEGDFELKIPEEMKNGTLFFSAVGFVNRKIPVSALFEKEFNLIAIEPQSYDIDDIDVAARSKVLIRILSMAAENIPYNFLAGPFNLECSYKKDIVLNDTVNISQKATVLVYDRTGYSSPSKADAYNNVKYSLNKERWEADYRFSTGTTNMDELLAADWVRSATAVLNRDILNGYNLKLEAENELNGKSCWVISFEQKKPDPAGSGGFFNQAFSGKITIYKDDYSVAMIEGGGKASKSSRQGLSLAAGNNAATIIKNLEYSFAIKYRNLVPQEITLNKKYESGRDKISENISLNINRVVTSQVVEVENRQYFTGE